MSLRLYVRSFFFAPCRPLSFRRGGIALRLILVLDQELDGARRRVALVLVAMDRAARDVDALARLEHPRRLASDAEGDLALDHHLPLVAVVGVVGIALPVRQVKLH